MHLGGHSEEGTKYAYCDAEMRVESRSEAQMVAHTWVSGAWTLC